MVHDGCEFVEGLKCTTGAGLYKAENARRGRVL